MAISARSPFMAGTAAMFTASAIAVTGAGATGLNLPSVSAPSMAKVEMAAFASPLLEIFDTIQKTNLYLFSIAEPPVTTFDYAGIIPDFLAAGFPIATQYFLNAPNYISQTINYLFTDYKQAVAPVRSTYPGALRLLTWAVDALPANLVYATQQLFSGNLVGTLRTLQFAAINPIQAALYQVLNAGLYALGGVGVRAAAVITAIAEWVPTTIRNLADDVTVVLNAATRVLGNVAFGIQTGNLETVWNSLVVGLLGTSGNPAAPSIPDALIDQTIGEGGRIYTTPGQPGYQEIPSIRQNLAELRDNIKDALGTDVPVPEDPPFPVTKLPNGSQIPTPWNPTPGPAPVAAVAAAESAVTGAADVPTAADVSVTVDKGPADAAGRAGAARSHRGGDLRGSADTATPTQKAARSAASRSTAR